MELRLARKDEFTSVQSFYREVIDLLQGKSDTVGWKKGIYPSDQFLKESIEKGELYVLDRDSGFAASVIVNSRWNEGYEGLPWSIDCPAEGIAVPHALAVHPALHGQGVGRLVVSDVISIAKAGGKKTMRLDILQGNTAAERLYTGAGFRFVRKKTMFYEDTGWTEYLMYELIL